MQIGDFPFNSVPVAFPDDPAEGWEFGLTCIAALDLSECRRRGLLFGGPQWNAESLRHGRSIARRRGYRYSDQEIIDRGHELMGLWDELVRMGESQ